MVTTDSAQYKALVDEPNEILSVEYKSWLDLTNNEVRADLARHIAALANYGGGYIVFGITNAMQYAGNNPFPTHTCDRDQIASIVKKYLEPPFQCDVLSIKSSAGNEHPVVVVPPHGATPICAKANGPQVGKKTVGIVQGVHYIRKPGPESAPIENAAEWAPIIRRCAMHDRAAVFGALDAALRGSGPPLPSIADELMKWNDAAHRAFLQHASAQNDRPNIDRWHWQVSYAIDRTDGQILKQQDLMEILRQLHAEVRDTVRIGWDMIDPNGVVTLAPYFETDATSGLGDMDFLEFSALRSKQDLMFADMWRVSPDGKVTLIRDYWEDVLAQRNGTSAGTWISPNWMVRSLAEIVRHARAFTERFNNPSTCLFVVNGTACAIGGFIRPMLCGLSLGILYPEARTKLNGVIPSYDAHQWLARYCRVAPLMRSFSTNQVLTADWIRGQAPMWLR